MGFQKHEDIHSECESWTHVKRQIKLDLNVGTDRKCGPPDMREMRDA